MSRIKSSGMDELVAEFRTERDGLDCVFNVLVNIQASGFSVYESRLRARGLRAGIQGLCVGG